MEESIDCKPDSDGCFKVRIFLGPGVIWEYKHKWRIEKRWVGVVICSARAQRLEGCIVIGPAFSRSFRSEGHGRTGRTRRIPHPRCRGACGCAGDAKAGYWRPSPVKPQISGTNRCGRTDTTGLVSRQGRTWPQLTAVRQAVVNQTRPRSDEAS